MRRFCALLCVLTLVLPAAPQALAATEEPTAPAVEVYTDYSAYRPYTPPKARYTRLSPEPLTEFVPSEDYGAVYPYMASSLRAGDAGVEYGASWGFVDENGCILTDDIYVDIQPMTQYRWLPGHESQVGTLPLWITTRVLDPAIRVSEDGERRWGDGDVRYGVVSLDGRFALPCEYPLIRCTGDSFLCIEDWHAPKFTVYDQRGQLRFHSDAIYDPTQERRDWRLEFGDGLYLVQERIGGTERYWFADLEGNKILGPYADARPFSDGLASVSVNGTYYGVIDKSGNWVYEPLPWPISQFENGVAFLSGGRESFLLRQQDGRVVRRICDKYETHDMESCGFSISHAESYYNSDAGYRCFYDLDGNFLFRGGHLAECIDEDTFLNYDEEGRRCLLRLNGERLRLPSGNCSVWAAMELLDGVMTPGYHCWETFDKYGWETKDYFIPTDLSGLYELETASFPAQLRGEHHRTRNDFSNERWYFCWDGCVWHCRSASGQELSIPQCAELRPWGNRIMALTDTTCSYYDLDGELIFCFIFPPDD